MESLLDIGGAVKNALALGNLQEDQRRNDLQEQNLALRQQQNLVDQQNANTQYMNSIHSFLNDDRVKFDPQLEGALMNKWSALAGGPQVDFSSIQVGRESKRKLMQSTMNRDAQGAMEAAGEIAMTLPAKDLPGFLKSLEEYGEVHERVLKLAQDREVNAEKYQKLQDNNAIVAYARPLYTATSSAFRDQLRMTDNPDFKKLQSLYGVLKKNGGDTSSLLSSRDTPGVNKQAVSPLLDGGLANMALKADAEVQRLDVQIQQDAKMLDDHMHGIPLPDGVTPSMLRARIDTDSSLKGAFRTMQEWYEEPLDKAKYTGAHEALKAIEQRRLDVEALDKDTHAETVRIQQETLRSNQEKEQFKRNQDAALTDAQVEYAALPAKQRNPEAASRISRSIKESTGVSVKPEDIVKGAKDPNAPASKIEFVQEKAFDQELGKANVKDIKDTQVAARDSADIIDTIHQGRRILDAGVITGTGAEFLTNFGQALIRAGFTEREDVVANTKAYVALMAGNVGKVIKQFGAGTGLSDSDREYAAKMVGGDISVNEASIRKILDMNESAARNVIARHNKSVSGIRSQIPLTVDVPPEYVPSGKGSASGKAQQSYTTIKSDADYNKLPSGSIFIGPDGKKRRKP